MFRAQALFIALCLSVSTPESALCFGWGIKKLSNDPHFYPAHFTNTVFPLLELETFLFGKPTHHLTWHKRKILDPSSGSLAQRYEVVHVVSFPHLCRSLCHSAGTLNFLFLKYELLQITARWFYLCFLRLVPPLWHCLLQNLLDVQSSACCIWTWQCLTPLEPTQSSLSCT